MVCHQGLIMERKNSSTSSFPDDSVDFRHFSHWNTWEATTLYSKGKAFGKFFCTMKWYFFHICLVNAQETQWKPRVLLMPTAGTPTVFRVESWTELEGAKFATAPELSVYCKIWSTCPCYLYLCLFPCYFHSPETSFFSWSKATNRGG